MVFRNPLAKLIPTPYVTGTGTSLLFGWAHMDTDIILHARHEHGGLPIHILSSEGRNSKFRVEWPKGPVLYPSVRQMLIALYNQGDTGPEAKDPGMSFDRYFRRGRHSREPLEADEAGPTIFDMFLEDKANLAPEPPKKIPGIRRRKSTGTRNRKAQTSCALAVTALMLFATPEPPLSIAPSTHSITETALSVDPERVLGIDLAKRGHEVRKLLFAGFGYKMLRGGYDPDDVLQEVYRGLLARNKGICPFDVRKSSFGHYVHMVCGCVLANYHRKQSRTREFEQVGMYSPLADNGCVDAAEAAVDLCSWDHQGTTNGPELSVGQEKAITSLQSHIRSFDDSAIAPLAAEVVPLVFAGMTRSEIAEVKGLSPAKVGRALAFLRAASGEWAEEHDMVV